MRVAVTGATGFIGRHLVKALTENNFDIHKIVHQKQTTLANESVKIFKGSVDDLDSLSAAFTNCDVVCHLVGIIAETKSKTFDKTVIKGTEHVVKACLDCNVKKIIYISALGTDKNAKTKYHKSKYHAEAAIINSGLDYIILRPSVIYGEGDGFVNLLAKMLKLSPITPVIGNGKYLLQPVYIDDLITVITKSLTQKNVNGKIIDVAGPEKLEYLKILNIIKAVLKIKRLNFYVPLPVMKIVACVLETFLKPAPLTRDQLIMMEMGNCGDVSLMKELFSIEPIRFEDGLKLYLR